MQKITNHIDVHAILWGGLKSKIQQNLGKIPKVGGLVEKKQQQKNLNFNKSIFKNQGGPDFSKMSEI